MRKFAVDCMLGKLARWLRILGFDTIFDCRLEDAELLALSMKEGRILLTQDRELAARGGYLVKASNWKEQLKEVIEVFSLRDEVEVFSRCPVCNSPLKEISREDARLFVPPIAWSRATEFAICPNCGKAYWDGSHINKMEKVLKELGLED